MPYGVIKVDNIAFTSEGVDTSISISGLVRNPVFSGNVTSTSTISGVTVIGSTTISGATVTGTTAQFTNVTGGTAGFTTVTGATVTGTTANFVTLSGTAITGATAGFTTVTGSTVTGTTANFVTLSGTTVTGTTANFVTVSGTTVTGTTARFVTVSGTTVTGTTANFVSGFFGTYLSGVTIVGATGIFTTLSGIPTISGYYASLSGAQTFTGGQRGSINFVPYAATGIALDLNSANNFQITLSGNTTLQNPINIASGQAGIVSIVQGVGNSTMSFGSNWHYPGGFASIPTLTATNGATDVLAYYVVNTSKIAFRLIQDIKA